MSLLMRGDLVQKTPGLLRPSLLSEPHWWGAGQEKRRKEVFFQTIFGTFARSHMKFTAFS